MKCTCNETTVKTNEEKTPSAAHRTVFTVVSLQVHFIMAFAGFLGMLACVLVIERQLRAMSKVGLKDVAASIRGSRIAAQAMRSKFGRE